MPQARLLWSSPSQHSHSPGRLNFSQFLEHCCSLRDSLRPNALPSHCSSAAGCSPSLSGTPALYGSLPDLLTRLSSAVLVQHLYNPFHFCLHWIGSCYKLHFTGEKTEALGVLIFPRPHRWRGRRRCQPEPGLLPLALCSSHSSDPGPACTSCLFPQICKFPHAGLSHVHSCGSVTKEDDQKCVNEQVPPTWTPTEEALV